LKAATQSASELLTVNSLAKYSRNRINLNQRNIMGYFARNGRIYKEIFGLYGRIHYADVGPDQPMTTKRKALEIMSRYEHKGQTDNPNYRYAQRVASCLVVGQDTSSDFIRKR
jgi:hypothetical protein